MTIETRPNDDVTGKQLRLLIGLVVVMALAAVAWSSASVVRSAEPRPSALLLLGLVAAIAIANGTSVWIRIRANRQGVSWTEVGILVGLTLAAPSWVVLCTAVGVTVCKLSLRTAPQKAVFSIAKETVVATAAGLVFTAAHAAADPESPALHLGTIAVAAAVMWIVDESLGVPVIALATRTGYGHILRANWDLRVVALLARYAVAVLVIGILAIDGDTRLLVVVLPVVFCVHQWQVGRVRDREQRHSWQRLAQATDELNVVELASVLQSAVARAAELFSADEAEIELIGPGTDRLVRGRPGRIDHDGTVASAARRTGPAIPAGLRDHDGRAVGTLRLRFRETVRLTHSEEYMLRTFASALCTAIRNAAAYAEIQRFAEENAHAAAHDPLTGLANRRALLEHSDAVLGRRQDGMTALLLLDLNHFKEVNDTLGHTAGDQVLAEVARRLQEAARPEDLVARLGGDEFAVLLTGLPTPAMATHRADTLLSCLDRAIEVDGMHLRVEACGGIALAPGSGGVTELLRRADVAMYQAKRSGRRTAAYLHASDTADVSLLMFSGELSRAVAEREFDVDFQPIVDLGTGEVVAAEALARWHHPHHGELSPMRLGTVHLPAFADAVLIQALAAAESWRAGGFDIPVAVNVSPRSLLDPHFPAAVLDRLATAGVPADRLVLELTESLTLSQLEVVDRALADLRDAGVRLTLDDFGTGSSSLTVLSRIRVHELKIHQQFVRAVESSPEAAAVIRSTVDLGRSLQLAVTAEGVQSEPQRHLLWELGCVTGQGHLFSRPMPAGRLLDGLRRGSGGRPGTLAPALHDTGAVVRLPRRGRAAGRGALPHLPA